VVLLTTFRCCHTHGGAELDLLFFYRGERYGFEIKFSEAPAVTRSMQVVLQDLNLAHLWIIYPGNQAYPVNEQITVIPLQQIREVSAMVGF